MQTSHPRTEWNPSIMHPPSSSPSLFPACVCTKQGLKQTRSDAVSCKGPRSFVPCCVCESLFPQHMNSVISSINVYSLNVYCHYFKHWGEKKKQNKDGNGNVACPQEAYNTTEGSNTKRLLEWCDNERKRYRAQGKDSEVLLGRLGSLPWRR